MYHLYEQKDISYRELTEQSHTALKDLTASLSMVTVDSPDLEQKMVELSAMLKRTSGKKVYGYLKRPVKDKIDSIVDDLASISEVARCYAKWSELRDQLESYYRDKPREHLPLSQQKEFKTIKNMVIQEALKLEMGKEIEKDGELALKWLTASAGQGNEYAQFFLGRFDYFFSRQEPSVAASVIRLLHHMSRIFEDGNKLPWHPSDIQMDSKRRRQLMELKQARGLRIDDHEQKM